MSERLNDSVEAGLFRRRRRNRLVRFIALEALALAVVVASVAVGLSRRFSAESLTKLLTVVPIAGAAVAVALPILFFGNPKRHGPRT